MSTNGDHPSDSPPEYPMGIVPKEDWPTMPELPSTSNPTETARAYGSLAAAYHELCRQLGDELRAIRAERELDRQQMAAQFTALREQIAKIATGGER